MANNEVQHKNKFLETYIGSDDFNRNAEKWGLFSAKEIPIHSYKRLETRTRKENPDAALSFAVHDPLWMLTRQWQFGEFKGNDAGTAIWAKIKIEHAEITSVGNNAKTVGFNQNDVLEHQVERMNAQITNAVCVESAYYLKKSIDFSALRSKSRALIKHWQNKYPLETFPDTTVDLKTSDKAPKECIADIKKRTNKHLESYLAAFGNRSFDGYKVFLDLKSRTVADTTIRRMLSSEQQSVFSSICKTYVKWFTETYLPVGASDSFWVDEKLGYELSVSVEDRMNDMSKVYSMEDYHSGRLSWYSFDIDSKRSKKTVTRSKNSNVNTNQNYFTFIPVLAEFSGSPNKRLWAFEDMKVAMGNSELSAGSLANALVLQYTTMYGNDWLITPMELKAGMVSAVKGIVITDVFGSRYFINQPAGDVSSSSKGYSSKWEMFTVSKKDAYKNMDFTTDGHLFFPPSLGRNEESKPIEEVQFLRDEMANMLWAVEVKINDGCGNTLDGDDYAAAASDEIELLTPKYDEAEGITADYSYLFQNSVPLNWIPFSPVRFKPGEPNAIREIRLQRSTMPFFIKDRFMPIRPCTSLMRTGINENDKVEKHKFINEEEILAVGTKVMLSNQRTRWFNGKTFNWLGAKKEISKTQANSGLSFDELVEIVAKSASEIKLTKDEKK